MDNIVKFTEKTSSKLKQLEQLKNTGDLSKRLEKTRMCVSVSLGVPCKFLEKCKFAHSIEDLNVAQCIFDKDCSYVEFTEDGIWKNVNTHKICGFIHPKETMCNYIDRVKIIQKKSDNTSILKKSYSKQDAVQTVNISLELCKILYTELFRTDMKNPRFYIITDMINYVSGECQNSPFSKLTTDQKYELETYIQTNKMKFFTKPAMDLTHENITDFVTIEGSTIEEKCEKAVKAIKEGNNYLYIQK